MGDRNDRESYENRVLNAQESMRGRNGCRVTNTTDVVKVVATGAEHGEDLLGKREGAIKDVTEIFSRRSS